MVKTEYMRRKSDALVEKLKIAKRKINVVVGYESTLQSLMSSSLLDYKCARVNLIDVINESVPFEALLNRCIIYLKVPDSRFTSPVLDNNKFVKNYTSITVRQLHLAYKGSNDKVYPQEFSLDNCEYISFYNTDFRKEGIVKPPKQLNMCNSMVFQLHELIN